MVTMYGIWFTPAPEIHPPMPASWLSAMTDFKGTSQRGKCIMILTPDVRDDLESDIEALSFWFSRNMAQRYYREISALKTSLYPETEFDFEIRTIKVSNYVASHLRERGWSFTSERDDQNA